MKRLLPAVVLAATALGCAKSAPSRSADNAPLTTEQDKTLYALGLALGRNVGQFSLTPAEATVVARGFVAAATGATPEVDLNVYGPKIGQLAQQRAQSRAQGNKTAAKAYLEKAAQEPGAIRTPSGLVYTSLVEGTGATPGPTDKVKVHYEGKLTDGTVFDSSIKRGQPVTFALNQVIPCWTEGLQHMKVGGKARLVCPSEIAYGDMGHPPAIPGGATLVFEVQLLDIVK